MSKKLTVKEALPNTQVSVIADYLEKRETPYLAVAGEQYDRIIIGQTATIVETPRSYQGCGRCVKFTIDNDTTEYYAFWTNFKNATVKL